MKPVKIKILKSPVFRKSAGEIRVALRAANSRLDALAGIPSFDRKESTAYQIAKDEVDGLKKRLSSLWQYSTITITAHVTKSWVTFTHGTKQVGKVHVHPSIKYMDLHLRNAVFVALALWTGGREHAYLLKNSERVVEYYRHEMKIVRKAEPLPDRSIDAKYLRAQKRRKLKEVKVYVGPMKLEAVT